MNQLRKKNILILSLAVIILFATPLTLVQNQKTITPLYASAQINVADLGAQAVKFIGENCKRLQQPLRGLCEAGDFGFNLGTKVGNVPEQLERGVVEGFWDAISTGIALTLLSLGGMLVWLAGLLFDASVFFTIENMAVFINNTKGVDIAWRALRDMVNMLFIFALLYIAIATILRIEQYGAKKLLTRLIIIALLINFSLFFTKVVIDGSNILAHEFVDGIRKLGGSASIVTKVDPTGNATLPGVKTFDSVTSITAAYVAPLGIATLFGYKSSVAAQGGGASGLAGAILLDKDNLLTIGIMGFVFLLITAFILFAGAITLIGRFIALIFIMVSSPLAFAGMLLPATQSYAQDWWKKLFKHAVFAPVYMGLMLIVAVIINDDAFQKALTGQGGFAELFTRPEANIAATILGGPIYVVLNFIIISGLMISALITASKFGAAGSDSMLGWLKGVGTKTGVQIGRGAFAASGIKRGIEKLRGAVGIRANKFMKARGYQGLEGRISKSLRNLPLFTQGLGNLSKMPRDDIEANKESFAHLDTYALRQLMSSKGIRTTASQKAALLELLEERGSLAIKGERYDLDEQAIFEAIQYHQRTGGRETRKRFEKLLPNYTISPERMRMALSGGVEKGIENKSMESFLMAPVEKFFRMGRGTGDYSKDRNGVFRYQPYAADKEGYADEDIFEVVNGQIDYSQIKDVDKFHKAFTYVLEDHEKGGVYLDKNDKIIDVTDPELLDDEGELDVGKYQERARDEKGRAYGILTPTEVVQHRLLESQGRVGKYGPLAASKVEVQNGRILKRTGETEEEYEARINSTWDTRVRVNEISKHKGMTWKKLTEALESEGVTDDGLHKRSDFFGKDTRKTVQEHLRWLAKKGKENTLVGRFDGELKIDEIRKLLRDIGTKKESDLISEDLRTFYKAIGAEGMVAKLGTHYGRVSADAMGFKDAGIRASQSSGQKRGSGGVSGKDALEYIQKEAEEAAEAMEAEVEEAIQEAQEEEDK